MMPTSMSWVRDKLPKCKRSLAGHVESKAARVTHVGTLTLNGWPPLILATIPGSSLPATPDGAAVGVCASGVET